MEDVMCEACGSEQCRFVSASRCEAWLVELFSISSFDGGGDCPYSQRSDINALTVACDEIAGRGEFNKRLSKGPTIRWIIGSGK